MKIQEALRTLGKVEFEGAILHYAGEWRDLNPGDLYVAERNSGPKLLTVREVCERIGDGGKYAGAVFPMEAAYAFDLYECVKVTVEF